MLQGMLQIRRSMAVAAISGVLIFGSLIGAGLSLWAKHVRPHPSCQLLSLQLKKR
jgi:hypothetical protein